MSCSKCGKQKCCCPRTIRGATGKTGPIGKTGPAGPTGPTGPTGPAGTLNGTVVNFDAEQTIAKADLLTAVSGATASLAAGTYLVWTEFDIFNAADDTQGTYGLYLDAVLQNNVRNIGTTDVSGYAVHHYHKCALNNLLTVTGTQVLTIKVQLAEGTIAVKQGSILYQKIS